MNVTLLRNLLLGSMTVLAAAVSAIANPDLDGRWRMDPDRSSPLSGWQAMDLEFASEGNQIDITYHMRWRRTRVSETNTVDVTRPVIADDFFRVEARHMAVYPTKGGSTVSSAEWLDGGRTLRTESDTSVEISQGDVPLRITTEYRIGEGGETLTVIELRSSRPRPLVYFLRKVNEEETK